MTSVDCGGESKFQSQERALSDSVESSMGNRSLTKMSAFKVSNGKYSGLGNPASKSQQAERDNPDIETNLLLGISCLVFECTCKVLSKEKGFCSGPMQIDDVKGQWQHQASSLYSCL